MSIIESVRNEVLVFAELMEKRLKANDHKCGWKGLHPAWLLSRLEEEIEELRAAMLNQDIGGAITECADVANFAMMLVDVFGGYDNERKGEQQPSRSSVQEGLYLRCVSQPKHYARKGANT